MSERAQFLLSKGVEVSIDETRSMYSSQQFILDGCSCPDCVFYVEEVVANPFSFQKELILAGVDIAKNIDSEPTGTWCIRDDNGTLNCFEHVYQIVGTLNGLEKKLEFKTRENGFLVAVQLEQTEKSAVRVQLWVSRDE